MRSLSFYKNNCDHNAHCLTSKDQVSIVRQYSFSNVVEQYLSGIMGFRRMRGESELRAAFEKTNRNFVSSCPHPPTHGPCSSHLQTACLHEGEGELISSLKWLNIFDQEQKLTLAIIN